MKLLAKIKILGKIKAETGLHIGGSKSSLEIGGVDLNVIKTPNGIPFIPGSSLKGKLRSLLAKIEGSMAVTSKGARGIDTDEDFPYILELFGSSGDDKSEEGKTTRLLIRDAVLDASIFKVDFEDAEMDLDFTDVKWENTIDRKRGTAQHPRQLERVPAGATFDFEMIYDLYDDASEDYTNGTNGIEISPQTNSAISRLDKHLWAIQTAMGLLQDDYLGGHGSRGYGKVSFQSPKVIQKVIQLNTSYKAKDNLSIEFQQFETVLQQL